MYLDILVVMVNKFRTHHLIRSKTLLDLCINSWIQYLKYLICFSLKMYFLDIIKKNSIFSFEVCVPVLFMLDSQFLGRC